MTSYAATCRCGQLSATVTGDPVRVSVCHCHNCQKRSGSTFAAQARWPVEQVAISGQARIWQQAGDEGGTATFSFCPDCGSSLFYTNEGMEDLIAIAMGGFAGTGWVLPVPQYSVYESRKPEWVAIISDGIDHWQ